MKRNALLVALILFGVAAVGALFLLAGSGNGRTVRAASHGDQGGDVLGPGASPKVTSKFEVTEKMARGTGTAPGSIVEPGARKPWDSPETIAARERYASRIEELVQGMVDPTLKPDQRMALARELQQLLRLMGHRVTPAVRERLLQMLATVEPGWKDAVAGAIGSLDGDTDTAQALLDMLRNTPDDIATRRGIYSALGMMNVPEVTPALLAMLGQGLQDEPLIIRTIGQTARPDELLQLFGRLDKPLMDASRMEIERVLQERGRFPGFMDKVAAALDGANVMERRSLLRILAASDQPEHATKVREILKTESDSESRALAIQALGRFGDVESGKALLDLVQTGSPEDQHRATNAIYAIRERDTVDLLAKDFGNLDAEGRIAVMGAISRVPAPTEQMTKIAQERGLSDPELRVRTAAARVLGVRGRDESVDALVAYVQRSDQRAEWNAGLLSLERIHTPKAANAAIPLLRVVPNSMERDRLEKRFQDIIDNAR
jgi:HEAT repeat protein